MAFPVIKVFVRDSVSVHEKTSVTTKHDTVTGTDTVFVVREFYKDRWKLRTDTIQKTVYISREKASTIEKKKEDKTHKKMECRKESFRTVFMCCYRLDGGLYICKITRLNNTYFFHIYVNIFLVCGAL